MLSKFSIFASMRRLLMLLAALLPLLAAAQTPQQDYIAKYAALAVSEMQRTGVPASITLAQGLLESAAGLSPLAVHANNHFGIKCHDDWEGETFYKDDDSAHECFRAYPSAEDSFRAHSDFLRNRANYRSLFDLDPTDYKAWARGLKKAGYATDPSYADKLIRQIEMYGLARYDHAEADVTEADVAGTDVPEAAVPQESRPDTTAREKVRYDEMVILPI